MRRDWLTRGLTVLGTLLTALPFVFIAGISAIRLLRSRVFLFDFLFPAEVFFVILIGAALLIWAAFRSRLYQRLIPILFGLAVFFLIASQVLAQVSGLATGEISAEGGWWVIVLGMLAVYDLLAFGVFISGIFLTRDVFQRPAATTTA